MSRIQVVHVASRPNQLQLAAMLQFISKELNRQLGQTNRKRTVQLASLRLIKCRVILSGAYL